MIDAEERRYAETLGRRHFEGTVTLEALFEHFGKSDDPLIRALLEAAAGRGLATETPIVRRNGGVHDAP